jgi:hypothetical protein
VLLQDQTVLTADQQPDKRASAMTYKFVGVLRSLTDDKPYQRTAIWIGILIGLATEVLRKFIKARAAYRRFAGGGRVGFAADFLVDAVLLPSPYASSFGGFVNLPTSAWFAAGGAVASFVDTVSRHRDQRPTLPEDMSTTSLVGAGSLPAMRSPRSGWASPGCSRPGSVDRHAIPRSGPAAVHATPSAIRRNAAPRPVQRP